MKSSISSTRISVRSFTNGFIGLTVFVMPFGTALAQTPLPPSSTPPDELVFEIPLPPGPAPEPPIIQTSTTTATTTQTNPTPTVSGGGGSSSGRSGGGGGGGSSRSRSSSSKKSSNQLSVTSNTLNTKTTIVRCSSPTLPATDVSGNLTLTGLIDLFVALGIIPQDRAARACAALNTTKAKESTATAVVETSSFTKTLSMGETHPDVVRLQKFLNARGFSVATQGTGSKGQESAYYDIKTAVAVARFQETYSTEILTPSGLKQGSGNFDSRTMQKANQLIGR